MTRPEKWALLLGLCHPAKMDGQWLAAGKAVIVCRSNIYANKFCCLENRNVSLPVASEAGVTNAGDFKGVAEVT